MDKVVLGQICGSLGLAIENLMAMKKTLEELLPKEEPQKEKAVDDSDMEVRLEDEMVVELDDEEDEQPRRKSDAPPASPHPKINLDGKISFSFEGTISVHE